MLLAESQWRHCEGNPSLRLSWAVVLLPIHAPSKARVDACVETKSLNGAPEMCLAAAQSQVVAGYGHPM
jgi:hypothetical protein